MTFLDRIKETSTSTGTGTFTLGGAVLGYKVFTNGTYKYCIVNETESEWEVGEGTVTSGVLTRTTIEASSNGGAAVSFSAGTKYVFNTVSATYVNSLVPYTGSTAAVNLGAYGITSDYLQLSTTPTASGAVGRMLWNDTDGTMDIGLKGGNVTLQVGQEQVVRVVNKVGSTLTEAAYQAVYISGAQGQRPKVALAQANVDATSASTIGLVTETIADNQEGFITTSGIVRGINTTGSLQGETWADGDIVYLSPTTAGRITNIKPTAPNHTVVIGYVVYAHSTQGKIFVKVDNGYELTELHDIYAPSPTTGQSIYWNATNSRYELNTIAGVLGYTPADDSLVVHLAGAETITGVKTFQNAIKTTTGNNLLNTGGGNTVIGYTADPASSGTYKLDVNGTAKINGVVSVSGVVIGVGTLANGQSIKGSASGNFTFNNSGGGGWYYEWIQNSATAMTLATDNSLLLGTTTSVSSSILTLNSTTKGVLLPRMTTAQKTAITTPATSLMVYDTDLAAFQYYTGSAWAGLGGGITGSGTAGQVTYWSGTSAVTGSGNLFWDATKNNLGIGSSLVASGYKLGVQGNIAFTGYLAFQGSNGLNNPAQLGYIELASASFDIYVDSSRSMKFFTGAERMRLFTSTGNLMLQNGGTFTDGGQRLQVIGSMRVGTTAASAMYWDDTNNRLGIGTSSPSATLNIVGAGNTSATTALTVQNSDATGILRVRNDNKVLLNQLGFGNDFPEIFSTVSGAYDVNGGSLSFNSSQANYGVSSYNFYFRHVYSGKVFTSGTGGGILQNLGFSPTSGTGIFNQVALTGTINQTGGANGITRGLYVNPTLTAAADFRAIETTNGRIVFGNLPTSSAGLPTGALWNNSGVINIV